MTSHPRHSIDDSGTSPHRDPSSKSFALIIAGTVIVLLGLVLTFALRSTTSGASKPIDSTPAKSTGSSLH